MRKITVLVVFVLAALAASGAPIVLVDNFSTSVNQSQVGPGAAAPAAIAVGGFTRTNTLVQTAGALSSNLNTNGVPNTWSLGTDNLVEALGTSTYTNGVSFDATAPYAYVFSIDLVGNIFSGPAGSLRFFIEDADGTNLSWTTTPLANMNLPVTYSASVATFITSAAGGTVGLDLASIAKFGFEVSGAGANSLDPSFHNFSVNQVPEPGTYALMGLGLAGLALLRRRK